MPESLQGNRPSACGLERVVPIAQRQTIGEVVVALATLELFKGGLDILRYRVSYDGVCSKWLRHTGAGAHVRNGFGRELPWSPRGCDRSTGVADGEVEVCDLPEAGTLEVEVTRLVSLAFDEEAEGEVVENPYGCSWVFRFST